MREYLKTFMHECEYPSDAACALLRAYDRLTSLCGEELSRLISEYDEGYNIDYEAAIERMRRLSKTAGIHEYTGALILFLCYTKRLREYYKRSGISDEIFLDTALDLRYKLDECKCVHGVVGTFVAKWFSGFFKLERFHLGRLQFEIVDFGTEYEIDGVRLKPESRVVNVHIPRTGGRLDRESTLASYRLAADFYRDTLGEEIFFVCSSWLLFPKHREMLRQGSNLLAFMEDFEIYASGEYPDYSQAWRLFDVSFDGDPSHLPTDSSLRRAYAELIARGEPTGWGKGVFKYKE